MITVFCEKDAIIDKNLSLTIECSGLEVSGQGILCIAFQKHATRPFIQLLLKKTHAKKLFLIVDSASKR